MESVDDPQKVSENPASKAVDNLRSALAPLVERLTPEVEPALIYVPQPEIAQ